MPRPKHFDPPVKKTVNLPQSVIETTERYLHDPVRGKARHGALGSLMTQLLIEWNARKDAEHNFRQQQKDKDDGNLTRTSPGNEHVTAAGPHQQSS